MDDRVQAIIELGVDEARAQEAVKRIDAIEAGLKGAEKQAAQAQAALRRLAETGEKLRTIGAAMAGVGAGLLAPLILSANTYAERYKGLESTANKFIATQQRQADVTARLGREAAAGLVPVMNQVLSVEEKIVSFAEKHPELVNAAIATGGALAIGGGALVAAGTAVSTISKAAEVLKGIGPLGAVATQAAGALAVVAAGAGLAYIALKTIGALTNDPTLKDHDPLKAYRELVASAAIIIYKAAVDIKTAWDKTQDDFASTMEHFPERWKTFWDDFGDRLKMAGLGIQKFAEGLYDEIQKSPLGKLLNMQERNSGMGPNGPSTQYQIDQLQKGIEERDKATANAPDSAQLQALRAQHEAERAALLSQSALQKLTDWAVGFANSGTLGGGRDQQIKDFATDFKAEIAKVLKSLGLGGDGGTGPGARTNGIAIPPEAVNAYIQRNKALTNSDRQYAEDKERLGVEFRQAEQKAEVDFTASKAKINSDFMQSELKAAEEFATQENKQLAQERKDRARAVEDMVDSLRDAAARGDVEQFILAQKAGEKQLKRMDEDQAAADKERVADYAKQRQEARASRDQQLRDLEAQFRKEQAERRTEYNNQLTALRQKHDIEKREIDRAFAEQIAALQQNLAGLYGIQTKYYANMTAAAQAFITNNQGYLQSLLNGGLPSGGSTYTSASTYTAASTGISRATNSFAYSNVAATGRGYAGGLGYVPRDMFALIHQGEKIVPASMNPNKGGAGGITVYNTVGDVTTKAKLDAAINQMSSQIAEAIRGVT